MSVNTLRWVSYYTSKRERDKKRTRCWSVYFRLNNRVESFNNLAKVFNQWNSSFCQIEKGKRVLLLATWYANTLKVVWKKSSGISEGCTESDTLSQWQEVLCDTKNICEYPFYTFPFVCFFWLAPRLLMNY